MALTAPERMDCPPSHEIPFATLGDVNRLGASFCTEPRALEYVAGVQGYRAFRMQCLATTLRILDACDPPVQSIVSVRLKRLDSIRRKMARPGTNFRLGTLDDIIGVRVICQNVDDVRAVSGRIEGSPHFHRNKDYIDAPADTGYRGIHHIMRFEQPASTGHSLAVRFEIQVRTCLQHRWAVWCEAHGEKAKIGHADDVEQEELRSASADVALWERANPARTQDDLLPYSGARSIAVCWRPRRGPTTPFLFQDDHVAAVRWLNRLEGVYPAERENALLVVGVAEHVDIERALRLTHPLYAGVHPVHPRFYIPSTSR